MIGLRDAVGAAALLAVVMTLGDAIWAALAPPHLRLYGVPHGAIMCLFFGLVIGWRAGRLAAGAIAGPIIGIWTHGSPPAYHVNLGSWFVAYLAGFVPLFFRLHPQKPRR